MELQPGETCKLKDICKYNSNAYNIPCYGALENRESKFVCEIWEENNGNNPRVETVDK